MADETPENNNENGEEKPKKEITLFRKEAMEYKKGSVLGKVLIITPISYSVWTVGLFLVAVLTLLFLYFGKYSKQQDVTGMLVPSKGLINIYAGGNPGVITEIFVKQDEEVTKNQLLLMISTEQHTRSIQGAVAQQIENLEKQLEVKKNQVESVKKNLGRYKKLLTQKIIAEAEYQKYYSEYLSYKASLHDLEQKLINAKGSEDYAVRSPTDGTISNLVAMVGDRIIRDRPLASIIPEGATLQAILYVPSTAIGFVKLGQKVLLKYDAYPYQNFGLYESTVSHIDKSILFPKDLDMPMPVGENPQLFMQKPFYRVIVALKSPYVKAYGKELTLRPGMTLHGSILGDKRRIWQWILDPIYSLRGSLTSS